MDDELLTTKAIAALLCVHPKHVYRLLRRGLPAVRVGDEWRFVRSDVLRWAAERAGRLPASEGAAVGALESPLRPAAEPSAPSTPAASPPPLLAANGDCAVELLLELLPRRGPLLGLVTSDHAGSGALLAAGRVLCAGQHGDAPPPRGGKWARIHLVTREVGLAAVRRFRRVLLGSLPGSRFASRPATAGVRRRLDGALERAGTDLASAYSGAIELGSHRDVVLAVASGHADIGLTTQAWASRAGLEFQALGSETYDLVVAAERLGDPAVVALCELVQSAAFRRQLRSRFGYDVSKTGELRIG